MAVLMSLLFALPTAEAGREDDDLFGDEEDEDEGALPEEDEETPAPERPSEEDLLGDEEEEDLQFLEEEPDEEAKPVPENDLLEDEEVPEPVQGKDTATIFKEEEKRLSKLEVDEQISGWEQYLATYPNSTFRTRIEAIIDGLEGSMYDVSGPGDGGGESLDANKREVAFAHALLLENFNPRTRFQAGFEWGLPAYANLVLDYEYAIVRTFSLHGGFRNRYSGWSLEPGARWALVKSTKAQTVLSVLGDVHLNLAPFFVGARPQLAIGKRFGERLEAQLQGGVEVEARKFAAFRALGGANVTFLASDDVAVFAETLLSMKHFGWEGGPFRFNVASIGMKFYPSKKTGAEKKNLEVNAGASVPYTVNYWQFHYGSVAGQVNYFP